MLDQVQEIDRINELIEIRRHIKAIFQVSTDGCRDGEVVILTVSKVRNSMEM